jgi:hypothetical protein
MGRGSSNVRTSFALGALALLGPAITRSTVRLRSCRLIFKPQGTGNVIENARAQGRFQRGVATIPVSHDGHGRGAGVGRDLRVGVALGVGVTVEVGVVVAVGVGVGVLPACTSKEPISMRPFLTRGKPGPR